MADPSGRQLTLNKRPIIGITGPQRKAMMPRLCVAMLVRLYGATPRQLRPDDQVNAADFDALVITGGHDVDPVLYAAEPEVQPNYDSERDTFERHMIEQALQHKTPLLGICRGAQLLNICRGGNLLQELKSRRRVTSNRWTILPLKTLCARSNTLLHKLINTSQARINSLHNQAIDQVGEGLDVSARDLDGIIQAIEDTQHPYLLGVQWHPEFLFYMKRQRQLFKHLVSCARVRLQQRA